ncbi:SDR family NAD(P)-dependent oxidoreductase [Micromonospora sp. Llam0]|uniref:SDR family NAD(P)-dependent oxidoreductase n=1 Tax=Micromonospora sp. Llam0 TaxID=2485143 RepID=UPI0018F6786D|nr:SDR family oxidoreductase [Micromonospora sp. Llam0]
MTGASRGIGRATAVRFAAQGASVAVNYRSRNDEAAEAVKQIEDLGGAAVAIQADVSDPDQAAALVEQTRRELGGLHYLINNAGTSRDSLIFDLDVDELWQVMRVNLGGVVNMTQAAMSHLMSQRDGSIVNVSSMMAQRGWTGESAYAASKGAINAFTLASAVELARFKVRVNAVLPGFTRTELVGPRLDGEKGRALARQIPLRGFGDVEQIAQVISYVAQSPYMTGSLVPADGGFGAQLGIGRIGG